MKKVLIGMVAGVALAIAGYAVGANQVSAAVKVSCWNDGTVHVDPIPLGQ